MSTALLTDHYEVTILDAAIRSAVVDQEAVFEVRASSLPKGRRYGVVAGSGRIAEGLAAFTFGGSELAFLEESGVASEQVLEWLDGFSFSGSIHGYREGEPYFPGSPVLTVVAPFGEALLVETLVLSILNHDSAVAAAGARRVSAASGRPLIDVGSRRTHESAAVAAARAAYVVGFASTSNLEAGLRYGIPTAGTAESLGSAHIDGLAADLLERALAGGRAEVDDYDLEATVALGAGVPTAGFEYELVAIAGSFEPVASSPIEGSASVSTTGGGRRWAGRRKGADRRADAEVVVARSSIGDPSRLPGNLRPLQTPIVVDGEAVTPPLLEDVRAHHQLAIRDLGDGAHDLSPGEPLIPTINWL